MTSRPVVLLRAPPASVTIFFEFTTYAENRRLWVNRVGLTMSELCPLSSRQRPNSAFASDQNCAGG
jgi:hypothetical protein